MVWSPLLTGADAPRGCCRDDHRILVDLPGVTARRRPGQDTPQTFGATAPASTIEKTEVRP